MTQETTTPTDDVQRNGASDSMVHVTRADRFTSFDLAEHPVPHGREEDSALHPDASHPSSFRPGNLRYE